MSTRPPPHHVNDPLMCYIPISALLHPSEKRHVTWFATLDGAIASFLPLSEKKYRRLFMLHNKLVTAVPHVGGLNPKKFRFVTVLKMMRRCVQLHGATFDGLLMYPICRPSNITSHREISHIFASSSALLIIKQCIHC